MNEIIIKKRDKCPFCGAPSDWKEKINQLEKIIEEWYANELTPEDFKEILSMDYGDC